MKASLQAYIDDQRALVETAQAFLDKVGPNMPDAFPGFFAFYDKPAKFFVSLREGFDVSPMRDRLLAVAGEVFGRDGWTRHMGSDRQGYDWRKNVEGVSVIIINAQSLESPLEGSPVLPAAFPLLLEAPSAAARPDEDMF